MARTKRKKLKLKFKKSTIYIALICIATLFLGVGYSQIAGISLNVTGQATTDVARQVLITNVEYLNGTNVDPDDSTINETYLTLLNSTITLGNDLTSTISYTVTLKNNGLSNATFNDAIYSETVGYDNLDIVFDINGIEYGDELAPGESRNVTITFKYKPDLVTITNNELNSIIDFKFDEDKYIFELDEETFDGTNYIDTGIKLFSEANAKKDFEIRFTIDSYPSGQNSQAVLFGNMNESGEPYPGVLVRYENGTRMIANVGSGNKHDTTVQAPAGTTVVIKRVDSIVSYSLNGGTTFTTHADYSTFTNYFDVTATFGAGLDRNLNPFRYFKGQLSDMSVKLFEPKSYTVEFDANGGVGTMSDQTFAYNFSEPLRKNTFTKSQHLFDGWNTEPDGSGTAYTDEQSIIRAAQDGETLTLYAQWKPYPHYKVRFNSNGGSGTMNDQDFIYGTNQALTPSTFTKQGYIFTHWNTKDDGTGTVYLDEEVVGNLTTTEGDIVVLYAIYGKSTYTNPGPIVFDGTNYLNTEVPVFSNSFINRDFELSFTIDSIDTNANLNTLVSCMREVSPYPGLVFRYSTQNSGSYAVVGNFGSNGSVKLNRYIALTSTNIVIKRENGVLFMSVNGGQFERLQDTSNTPSFEVPLTIGASLNNNSQPFRYFKGTVSNISLVVS